MEQKVKYAINLISENGQVVVSSREVAEHFGKEHKTVLRSIEELAAQNCATKCVKGFCTSSHAIGYNDCMLEMAKHGAAHKPIIYPEQ